MNGALSKFLCWLTSNILVSPDDTTKLQNFLFLHALLFDWSLFLCDIKNEDNSNNNNDHYFSMLLLSIMLILFLL